MTFLFLLLPDVYLFKDIKKLKLDPISNPADDCHQGSHGLISLVVSHDLSLVSSLLLVSCARNVFSLFLSCFFFIQRTYADNFQPILA